MKLKTLKEITLKENEEIKLILDSNKYFLRNVENKLYVREKK